MAVNNFGKGTQAINSFLHKELTNLASDIVEKAKENANWSSKIPAAFSIGSVIQLPDGKMAIDIIVDLKIAPEAAAFEYGSGIHRKQGASTYRIPKEGYGLAFFWDKVDEESPTGPKFKGILPDGRALFSYVDHPGVAARPYLHPAIEIVMKSVRERIAKSFVNGYVSSIANVTYIKVK